MFTAALIFLLLIELCSGSIFICAFFNRRFEDALPITFAVIVALIFIMGIVGMLRYSVPLLLIVTVLIYFISIVHIRRTNSFRPFCAAFFTTGFYMTVCVALILPVFLYGMYVISWDELTHWADVVKMMTTFEVLSVSPLSASMFPEYPPTMACFQYFVQKLSIMLGTGFTEWLLFYAYFVFEFCVCIPFFCNDSVDTKLSWIFLFAFAILNTVFQPFVYSRILIDPFLSTLIALSLVIHFIPEKSDVMSHLQWCSILFLLTLTKSIGFPFALLSAFMLFMREKDFFRNRMYAGSACLSALIPWALWKLSIELNKTSVHFGAANLSSSNPAYMLSVAKLYIKTLATRPVTQEGTLIPRLPTFAFLFILLVLVFLETRELSNEQLHKRYRKLYLIFIVANTAFFVSLYLTYTFVFSEEEAELMACCERYFNNMLMADGLVALILLFQIMQKQKEHTVRLLIAMAALLIAFTPIREDIRFATRRWVQTSYNTRSPYFEVCDTINSLTADSPARILLASDFGNLDVGRSWEEKIVRFSCRQNDVLLGNLPGTYESYDYVVMFKVSGEQRGQIYKVDHSQDRLYPVALVSIDAIEELE